MMEHQKPKKKIVIADDDLAILDVLSLFLEEVGYGVETIQDEQSLHARLASGLPDVLLLDIWMSGWHGGRCVGY